ncbi:endonuclease III [Oscillospiraceae bacterium MB08-C2-2]|nr:endonuclease III [Oscillospiraceae bacterium MB08-C2-2]
MTSKKKNARLLVETLAKKYPDAICSLEYEKPHELLIATRLSAQCTDARVNMVTPGLFGRFPTLESLAEAEIEEVEALVKTCGLYKTKARDIVAMCQMLIDRYGGIVPDTMEDLLSLPGVGRKTANLILGDVYHKPSVVCDTHCIRITNLLGLTDSKNPLIVENQLRAVLPPEDSNDFCHRLVLHGRAVCVARRPDCPACCMAPYCDYAKENLKNSNKAAKKEAK